MSKTGLTVRENCLGQLRRSHTIVSQNQNSTPNTKQAYACHLIGVFDCACIASAAIGAAAPSENLIHLEQCSFICKPVGMIQMLRRYFFGRFGPR